MKKTKKMNVTVGNQNIHGKKYVVFNCNGEIDTAYPLETINEDIFMRIILKIKEYQNLGMTVIFK